jgi:uncharacterized protein (DUF1778 family)
MNEKDLRRPGRPEGTKKEGGAKRSASIRWKPEDLATVTEAAQLCGVPVGKFIKATAIIQAGAIIKDRKRSGGQ